MRNHGIMSNTPLDRVNFYISIRIAVTLLVALFSMHPEPPAMHEQP